MYIYIERDIEIYTYKHTYIHIYTHIGPLGSRRSPGLGRGRRGRRAPLQGGVRGHLYREFTKGGLVKGGFVIDVLLLCYYC